MRNGLVAVAVVLAMAGCGGRALTSTSANPPVVVADTAPTSAAIPWADLPAPPYLPPRPLPGRPLSRKAPACKASHLKVTNLGSSGETDDLGAVLEFTNTSRQTCLLYGTPRATVYGPGHRPVMVTRHFQPGTSFDMPAGGSTWLWFAAHDDCLIGSAYRKVPIATRVSVRLHSGGLVTVSGLSMPLSCRGISESDFYRPTPPTKYRPEPLQGSRESLALPASVHAGSVLTYVLTIRNPTSHPLSMSPCPGFNQGLSVGTGSDQKEQGLNCDGHRSLPAGTSLRFEIELAVPADAPTGPASVYWDLNSGDFGQSEGARLEILGNDIPCHAAQLTASAAGPAVPFRGTGLYGGKDSGTLLTVVVTNTSPSLCTLQGAPVVSATGGDGRSVAFRFGNSLDHIDPPPGQARLEPGGQATTVLAWHAKWCAADPNPLTVTLLLPSNEEPVTFTPSDGWTPPACRGWIVRYNVSSTDFG